VRQSGRDPKPGENLVNEQEHETPASVRQPWAFLRRRRLVLIVLAIVLLLIVAYVRHAHQKQAAQLHGGHGRGGGAHGGQGDAVAVTVATVISGPIEVRIPALGTITPLATVTVKTQITGQLQKIAFTEGQLVHEGDFLAQIDPRPYDAALKQARGNLRRDQALLTDAKLDLKRFEELIKEDSIAGQQLDTQRALVDQYGGTIESDEAQVNTALINLQYTHITSPVTGRVGLRQVDQGNYVTPGDANGIVVITQLQPITAIFSVPEDNVSALMQALHTGTALTAQAYDRTNSTKLADGKVLTVDNQIDTTTGTVKLRAGFENKDGLLFPNQFVNIKLLVSVLENQTVMPGAAVHRGAPNGIASTFVYVVNADNTVSVRPVTLGVVDGEQISVTNGLAPGEIVVTEGGDRLRDGAAVILPADTPQHRMAPAAADRPHGGANGQHRKRPQAPASK
jgi:multidrug efflux system membrane fusion protein